MIEITQSLVLVLAFMAFLFAGGLLSVTMFFGIKLLIKPLSPIFRTASKVKAMQDYFKFGIEKVDDDFSNSYKIVVKDYADNIAKTGDLFALNRKIEVLYEHLGLEYIGTQEKGLVRNVKQK